MAKYRILEVHRYGSVYFLAQKRQFLFFWITLTGHYSTSFKSALNVIEEDKKRCVEIVWKDQE